MNRKAFPLRLLGLSLLLALTWGCSPPTSQAIVQTPLPPDPKVTGLCDAAFASPASEATPAPPLLLLMDVAYEEEGWDYDDHYSPAQSHRRLDPYLTKSEDEAGTLVCISETRTKVTTYVGTSQSGASSTVDGYRLYWEVRLVTWPDGDVIGTAAFTGGGLPNEVTLYGDATAIYGEEPRDEFERWILIAVGEETRLPATPIGEDAGGSWVAITSANWGQTATEICQEEGYSAATQAVRCDGTVFVFPDSYSHRNCIEGAHTYQDCFEFYSCARKDREKGVFFESVYCVTQD